MAEAHIPEDTSRIIMEGFLNKSPKGKTSLNKHVWASWKSRWLVLRESGVLQWYESKAKTEVPGSVLGSVRLRDCVVDRPPSDGSHAFIIGLSSEDRVLFLAAENEESYMKWLSALQVCQLAARQ